jgi:hypothetical protein
VADKKNVRVVTGTLDDVTDEAMLNSGTALTTWNPQSPPRLNRLTQQEEQSEEDVIIGITRRASDVQEKTQIYAEARAAHPNARPVALLSENSKIMARAKGADLLVLTSKVLRGFMGSNLVLSQ